MTMTKRILIGIAAATVLIAVVGCDLFGPSLDLVDVKDLPSFSSRAVSSREDAFAGLMGASTGMSMPLDEAVLAVEDKMYDQAQAQRVSFNPSLFTPQFNMAPLRAVTYEEDYSETGNWEEGTEEGSFVLVIDDERDPDNYLRIDGEAAGEMKFEWRNEARDGSAELNGNADFRLLILKDIQDDYNDYVVKQGSKAHWIADIDFSGELFDDSRADVSYNGSFDFGYTMTIDGVDGQAGKYVLQISVRERNNFTITEDDDDEEVITNLFGDVEHIGTLKVYDNDNNLIGEWDLESDEMMALGMTEIE